MICDRRAELLTLQEAEPGFFRWEVSAFLRLKAEELSKTNLFSKAGLGGRWVLFTLPPRNIGLHQAIRWQGRHHFLTAVDRKSPVRVEVTAARVEVRSCIALTAAGGVDRDKRPVYAPKVICRFPAVLTEKYLGFTQQEPMAVTRTTFVLVTPKPVLLAPGNLVEIPDMDRYVVQVCHLLDAYKNEYELFREGDV